MRKIDLTEGNDNLPEIGSTYPYFNAVNLTVNGLGGNDDIYLRGSFNTLNGDAGVDTLGVEGSKNRLNGGLGEDKLYAYGNYNRLDGGDGNDYLDAYGIGNSLSGGDGVDTFNIEGSSSTASGGAGDDIIYMDEFSFGNTAKGDDGIDTIYVSGIANKASGGADGDTLYLEFGYANELNGDAGIDTLIVHGGSGNVLNGGAGDDQLRSEMESYGEEFPDGGNTFNGGNGNDEISIFTGLADSINGDNGNDIIVLGTTGEDDGYFAGGVVSGGVGDDKIGLSNGGYNVIHGDAGDDAIVLGGWGGEDIYQNDVYGDRGNDVLLSTGLSNFLYGGSGRDTFVSYSQDSSDPGTAQLGNVMFGEGDIDSYLLRSISLAIATEGSGTTGELDDGDVVEGLLDVIYDYKRFETIDVDGTMQESSVGIDGLTGALALDAGDYAFVRGDYTAEGVFSVNSLTGEDLLLVYAMTEYPAQGAVVLVGVTDASGVTIGTVPFPENVLPG